MYYFNINNKSYLNIDGMFKVCNCICINFQYVSQAEKASNSDLLRWRIKP